MRPHRERVVAALALVIFLGGSYKVIVGTVAPSPGVTTPDISIPESHRELTLASWRRFSSEEPPQRNPFSVAEGWRRLDALPLPPPPYPDPALFAPVLERSPPPGEAGFIYLERPPREIGPSPDEADAANGEPQGESK
jgi:hypothetical protein